MKIDHTLNLEGEGIDLFSDLSSNQPVKHSDVGELMRDYIDKSVKPGTMYSVPYASNDDCSLQEVVESVAAAVAVRTLTCADVESRHTERFVSRVVDNRPGKLKFFLQTTTECGIQFINIYNGTRCGNLRALNTHLAYLDMTTRVFSIWPLSLVLPSGGLLCEYCTRMAQATFTGATTIR